MERQKPDPNKDHPDDAKKIKEAEKTIGDYKLKIGAEYEPKTFENFTYKYIEIADCREKLFHIYDDFNQKFFAVHKQKKELHEFMDVQKRRMNILHKLLPESEHRFLPEVPDVDDQDEYPEKNLVQRCEPGIGIEIDDILYLEKSVEDLIPKKEAPKPPPKYSQKELYEFEIWHSLRANDITFIPQFDEIINIIDKLPKYTSNEYYEPMEGGITPSTLETRYRWLMSLIQEQDNIILTVKDRINLYNSALTNLAFERFEAKFAAEFMNCYLITLNQELIILRDSEEIENTLQRNAEEAMLKRNEMQLQINGINRQMDECRRTCEKLTDEIAGVQLVFMSTIKGHRFFDFLRRIFKKKWKPPKPQRGDDESSESSSDESSSSEDENADTKSIDSTDMTTIRLDEDHCPPGLEKQTYDLAFRLRSQRHEFERDLITQQQMIVKKRAEVVELQKNMKYHEAVFAQEQDTLLTFRRKRQRELNKVDASIVLKMHQIQHFQFGDDYRDLSKAVLFDASHLCRLKGRVGEINEETLMTKKMHKINIIHLKRMTTDIKFMRFEIVRLEEEIRQEMMKKFGQVVKLDELEEEVLRKYIFELETTAEDELREIEEEMKRKKLELAHLEEELIFQTKTSNQKIELMTILQQEKNFLDDVIAMQELHYAHWLKPNHFSLDHDIDKLTVINREQKEQIECLEREICTLRLKSKPLQIDIDEQQERAKERLDAEVPKPCPDMFDLEAYQLRHMPDHVVMDQIQALVTKCFISHFNEVMSKDDLRKYSGKVARYLGQASYTFEGEFTDRIFDCLVENIETILPKKYFILLKKDTLRKLFNDILETFDFERTEVNVEEVVHGVFAQVWEKVRVADDTITLNKTQTMLERLFIELIEVMTLKEFEDPKTFSSIMSLLETEKIFDPRCISIENLVNNVTKYCMDNLVEHITGMPIRNLATAIFHELCKRKKELFTVKCSTGYFESITKNVKLK